MYNVSLEKLVIIVLFIPLANHPHLKSSGFNSYF